jgi:DNA-binding transcriptional ArsR family regulator
MVTAVVQVIQSAETAATLFRPARMRILEHLAEADSAAGIARRLGLPRQQVGYHMRELEQAGLVELVEQRCKGNCIERIVRAAARSYVISPEALGQLGAALEQRGDRFSNGFLVSLAARAIRDLAALCTRPNKAGKHVPTMALEVEVRFASPDARNAFAEELGQQVARLVAKYHDETTAGGRLHRFFGGVYPVIPQQESAGQESVRIS